MTPPAEMCGSGPQNIADPRKDCGSFVEKKFRALHRRNLNKYGQHYYTVYVVLLSALSPFYWLQNTWPLMTLNGHFTATTTNNHLSNYFYLLTTELVYITWPAEMRGSGPWFPEYLGPRKNCYIVRTLTNKTNISI